MKTQITVETKVYGTIEKIWANWTEPEHIKNWCFASDDWCVPDAANDLRVGGRFKTRMESKDGKDGFDFTGTYTAVDENERIEYTIDDGRKVAIDFIREMEGYRIIETFDAEDQNSVEMQKEGWQAMLDNFKKYNEQNNPVSVVRR